MQNFNTTTFTVTAAYAFDMRSILNAVQTRSIAPLTAKKKKKKKKKKNVVFNGIIKRRAA